MDRGAWQATVHRVTKSLTRLKGLTIHQTGQVIKYGLFKIYLFIWLHCVLVEACGIFSCSLRDLAAWEL